MNTNSRIAMLALLIAMAIAVHWVEAFIPRPAPFLRFGFANIFTLCALYMFGGLWAFLVVFSRVIIGSILSGTIFSPTFFFSLSGGIAAGIVMWAMPKSYFSSIGVSVAGALSHMAAQVMLAGFILQHFSILNLMPLFILVSVITGVINGYCAYIIVEVAQRRSKYSSPYL